MKAKKTRKTWRDEDMVRALEEVSAGMPVRRAARIFNVPHNTLWGRVCGRVTHGCSAGPKPILPPEDEKALVQYCIYCAQHGLPRTKTRILVYANAMRRKRSPSEDVPPLGKKWWHCFRRRHMAELSLRRPNTSDYMPSTGTSSSSTTSLQESVALSSSSSVSPSTQPPTPGPLVPLDHPLVAAGLNQLEIAEVLTQVEYQKMTSSSSASTSSTSLIATSSSSSSSLLSAESKDICGRCKQLDPPGNEAIVSWVYCPLCKEFYHCSCEGWNHSEDKDFECLRCQRNRARILSSLNVMT